MPQRRPSFLKSNDRKNLSSNPIIPFVGRKDILDHFEQLQSKAQENDDYRILNIYGVGGQGKTSLAREFCNLLKSSRANEGKQVAWASLDFETDVYRRDVSLALLSIRHQLRKQGVIFPAFDTAFGRYFMLTHQGRDIQSVHPELFFQENQLLSDLEGVGGDILEGMGETVNVIISGIPGVGSITKNIGKYSNKLQKWWQRRGNNLLEGLDSLEPHEITKKLPVFLAADIYEWLNDDESINTRRLTLVFDTYEALWRERSNKVGTFSSSVDEWVRTLVNDSVGSFIVILGREELAWQQHDPSWSDYICSWRLGELEYGEAEELLLSIPVEDQDLRNAMIESSECVAFYLKLQAEHYVELKRREQEPSIKDFVYPQGKIVSRFTDHIEAGLRQALKVSSCARFINESIFLRQKITFLGGEAAVSFNDLLHYSFWEELESYEGQQNRYRLHNVMREQLQALFKHEDLNLFKEIHQDLFNLYNDVFKRVNNIHNTVCKENNLEFPLDDIDRYKELLKPYQRELYDLNIQFDDSLQEGGYHLGLVAISKLPEWLNEKSESFKVDGRWPFLQSIWEHALGLIETSKFPSNEAGIALCLSNSASTFERQGMLKEAGPLYLKALNICEESLGLYEKQTVISMDRLAGYYQSIGNYADAEKLYQKALHIYVVRLEGGTIEAAFTMNNLGEVYASRGKGIDAEKMYKKAMHICKKTLGEKHPNIATYNNNLANLYNSLGRYSEAESLIKESIEINETLLGKSNPKTALVYSNLGSLYDSMGKYDKAIIEYKRAYEIFKVKLGEEHPKTATCIGNLGNAYALKRDFVQAEPLLVESLRVRRLKLGEHPETASSMNNLANLFHDQRNFTAAKKLYKEALEILIVKLGKEHPNTIITMSSLENTKKEEISQIHAFLGNH